MRTFVAKLRPCTSSHALDYNIHVSCSRRTPRQSHTTSLCSSQLLWRIGYYIQVTVLVPRSVDHLKPDLVFGLLMYFVFTVSQKQLTVCVYALQYRIFLSSSYYPPLWDTNFCHHIRWVRHRTTCIQCTTCSYPVSLRFVVIWSSHLRLGLPSNVFMWVFQTNFRYKRAMVFLSA
jgi:hypothetical protein